MIVWLPEDSVTNQTRMTAQSGTTLLPALRTCSALLLAATMTACPALAQVPQFDHVVVVVMENHSFNDIIGATATAPYINALASQGANFTSSFAIEHPSEPNYLDLFSGFNQGVTDDSCPHTFDAANLGSELIAANLTFIGYSEVLPTVATKCTSGLYARKHNPWVNFSNVPTKSNLPFTKFPSDFSTLPTLAFVVPNLCNDTHDCSITTGDTWLSVNIDAYAQWAKVHNSLLVLTWDEDDRSQSNQIPTLFVGALVIPGNYNESIDHFRVLATLETMYGLALTGSAADRSAVTDVWDQVVFSDGFE
jgi:hypothetical protein